MSEPQRGMQRPTQGQLDLTRKLVEFDPSTAAACSTVDADVYINPARFALEQDRLFRHLPLPIAPSALLKPGMAMTHDDYGLPLIVTRDRDGVAHITLNVCQHRGTRLIEAREPVQRAAVVCPYHAWSYRLDGTLAGLPAIETFAGLNKKDHGLPKMPSYEAGGLIWVGLDRANPPNFAEITKELVQDLDVFNLANMHVYRRNTHEVRANWKLIVEAFLETYHISKLHTQTISPFFAESVTVSDRIGIHLRAAVGRTEYLAAADTTDLDQLRSVITYTYLGFPATTFVISPDYVNILVAYPQAVDRTLVEDFMLIPQAPQNEKAEEHWRRSFELLDCGVFGNEDFRVVAMEQIGLASGALPKLVLGGLEQAIRRFEDIVDQYCG